jgi:membrane-associated phospholipid phosphatase
VFGRRRHAFARLVASGALAAWLSTSPTAAQSGRRLSWDPDWRRVGAPEYAITGALLVGSAAFEIWVPPRGTALWTRRTGFDRRARRAVVAQSQRARRTSATFSDTLAVVSLAQPLVVDSLFVAALDDQNADVAWQLEIISLQSYGISLFSNMVAKRLFARERPYGVMCMVDPDYTDCENLDRFRSFYSGHSAITATSAGLVCAHHTHLPLYGSGIADAAACAGATLTMLATGLLRMRSDRHWASDVTVGHVLGFATGFLLPSLIYYKGFNRRSEGETASSPSAGSQLFWSGSF